MLLTGNTKTLSLTYLGEKSSGYNGMTNHDHSQYRAVVKYLVNWRCEKEQLIEEIPTNNIKIRH